MDDQRAYDPVAHQARLAAQSKQKQGATLRFIGSLVLGGIAAWKLIAPDLLSTVEHGDASSTALWVAALVFAFGLASVDQILKAMGKS